MADEQLLPAAGGGYDLSSPGTVVWTLTDNQDTVRDLAIYDPASNTTTVVNHREFSAYGELTSQINPQTNSVAAVDCLFAYTGCPLSRFSENPATGTVDGIQNNLNRWYDAISGRWLSQDPIGFTGDDPNLYRYCGDDPADAVDPQGEQPPPGWQPPAGWQPYAGPPNPNTAQWPPAQNQIDAGTAVPMKDENGEGYKYPKEKMPDGCELISYKKLHIGKHVQTNKWK